MNRARQMRKGDLSSAVVGDILIVGGYGAVGRVIASKLAKKFPGRVIVAGRSHEKAAALAQELAGKIRPLQIDIFSADQTAQILDGVALVVICLDLPNTHFVELCFQKGVHYVDITASYDYLLQVEALAEMAKAGESTAVLSVGLAPGLTNLLARQAHTQFDELVQLDIHILLGLGEAHGEAAIRWMVKNMASVFTVREGGKEKRVQSFADGRQTTFPGKLGRRTTYRFNFADQHVLVRTLDIPTVSMRLAFDSVLLTKLLAAAQQFGLFKLLRYPRVQNALVKMLLHFHFGSEVFVLQVAGQGLLHGQQTTQTFAVVGERESRFTGLVAAQVVKALMTAIYPAGVFHIEQQFDLAPFIAELEKDGLQFHSSMRHEATKNKDIFYEE